MTLLLSSLLPLAFAGNPIGWPQAAGMADTNIHFFNDTFLAFSTHDFAPNNTGYLMKDWWVWSSPDLVEWSLESIVNPKVSLKWSNEAEQEECWATDAAFVNGKYYFYLSVGPSTVGVVSADHYTGPWTDPLGKPLLDPASVAGATFRDPCVFEEDDGSHYIIAGVFDYYIAKLGSDMITLAEPLKKVVVNHPYGPCGANVTDDKPFIHKENGIYYLSWGCFYGMSKSIYGPYETKGSVINTTMLAPAFRMNDTMELEPGTTVDDIFASRVQQRLRGSSVSSSSILSSSSSSTGALPLSPPAPPAPPKPWYRHEDLADRHGSFLKHAGQWYFASNDRSHSADKKMSAVYRDTVLCYIHFRSDGTMEPCVVNAAGVGTHDARTGPIEAEEFSKIVGGSKLDLRPLTLVLPAGSDAAAADGFAVEELRDGSELSFPKVTGITPNAVTTLRLLLAHAENDNATGSTLRLTVHSSGTHTAGLRPALLGSCTLPLTGGNTTFQWVECTTFRTSFDQLDLVFAFASDGAVPQEQGGARLDKFELV